MNGDRAFKIEVGDEFKELVLSARCIAELTKYNGPTKRHKKKIDKKFLKTLVVGACTLKRVKEDETPFDAGVVELVKGRIVFKFEAVKKY